MRFVIVAMLCVGCGGSQKREEPILATARLRGPVSGIIELHGDRAKAMEAAVEEMTDHCGRDQFQIFQEGEEFGENPCAPLWRVHYRCFSKD